MAGESSPIPAPRYRDASDDDVIDALIPGLPNGNNLDGDNTLSFLRVEGEDDEGHWQKPPFFSPQVMRAWSATKKWVIGPQPPRPWRVVGIFEEYQTIPVQVIDQLCPKKKQKIGLLGLFYFVWLLTFSLVLKKSAFAAKVDGVSPINIGCLSRFW
jgi:hypothetical protein